MPKERKSNKGKRRTESKTEKVRIEDRTFEREILGYMKAHSDQEFSAKQIATITGLGKYVKINALRNMMERMTGLGELEVVRKGYYRYIGSAESITGRLEVTRGGSGFILQDGAEDIFIAHGNMGKAFHGDWVKARKIKKRKQTGRIEGEIEEVIQRARTEFVGVVEEGTSGTCFFIADDPRINTDFYIPKDKLMGAKNGDKVLLRLLNWERRSPEGEVTQVLGVEGDHNAEMHAILFQFGFDPKFPAEVEEEVAGVPERIPQEEIARRRDFRDIPTFTIDPEDAKDFDDALSFRVLENGNFEVGVHIADVSYYVTQETHLDREAYRRATSVYLVDRTVPMLPEKLSGFLCSLRPHEEKLTYSAVFEMDAEANLINEWIGRTIIYSDHRFTYQNAQTVIDGTEDHALKEELLQLNKLAVRLREKRMGMGSIEFDTEEVKFILDEYDKPIGIHRKVRLDTHKLIEDFMLLANRRVAEYVYKIFDNPPLPSIYRIHDHPDPEKLTKLQEFIKLFGYHINLAEARDKSSHLNQLLQSIEGKPEKNVIESLAVRSMAKAVYSTKNIGHFGLGFKFYTHFTSPIRRYPDLLIHRLLARYQEKKFDINPLVLEDQCKHCSSREKTATEAERASIKYKQVEFLSDKMGIPFSGIVSGVAEHGFWVELDENLCEGFVPARALEDDFYSFNADHYCLVGYNSGKVIRLGDNVQVAVTGANMKRRTVDMVLIQKLSPDLLKMPKSKD